MPRCKICGKYARAGVILHSVCCEERATELMQLICDDYCKHVHFSADEEELEEECAKCRVAEFLGRK